MQIQIMKTIGSLIFYKMLARMLRKTSNIVGIKNELASKDIADVDSREIRAMEKKIIKKSIRDNIFIKFILEIIDVIVLVAFIGMIGICYVVSKHYI